MKNLLRVVSALLLVIASGFGQTSVQSGGPRGNSDLATIHLKPENSTSAGEGLERPDLTKQPTLYVVGYAHLDTEWRWEYPQVIDEYLANTLHDNFSLIDRYPHYVFNFSGANRY